MSADRRVLLAVAAVQLGAGLTGAVLSVRRRHPFDTPVLSGSAAHVGRDTWWAGTALGPPAWTLAAHGWALARLTAGEDATARRVLAATGAALVPGYLAERLVRRRLTPAGAEPAETAVVATGLAGAVAMAVLGAQPSGAFSGVRP
ncbi:hypothetical protein [Geodermatophilus nigrescens]|uniref:Uncharacterized protein n=1 Tax=Geodermatophilus nigrescens TaxID=1070870 RepID=A0A1M5LTY1_9ACTN|nr:hypothetical protein [Geodermatophilus nigrescens]SHG68562.1 hypothetical protein SAMN05444351_2926 [Geodermatophilus nigrescens]